MIKRILLYILIIILIGFSFLYFSQKKVNDKNTIVFWTLQLGTFDKYINNIISEFEKENPEYKIKWIDVPYAEGEKRTLAAILTDNPPDLINLTPDFSLLLAEKNALYDIKEQELSQFLPSLLETLKYNNKYYGIPFYATSAITLKNKELTNKTITKYNELFELEAKDNSYITMINFAENDTLLKLLNKYEINSPQNINSEKSIYLYNQFKKMYKNGSVPKESITQTHRDALEKYMSGQLMYLVTGANFLNMIKENAPTIYKNTEVIPQLVGDSNKYDYSLMNFVIPQKAKNKDIAVKFALYLTNEINQLEFAKLTPILPVNKKTLKDEYFTEIKDNDIQAKARIISAKQLNNLQTPLANIKNKKELNTLSSNYIQELLINNADIETTLEKFAKDWEKL